MKTVSLLLSLMVITICCNNKNSKHAFNNKLEDTMGATKKDSVLYTSAKKNSFVSVVRPQNPEHTLTVGGDKADIRGYTSQAIQTAIDALHNLGGGTVKILPGNYEVIAPVKLFSNITLTGSGSTTVLKKSKGTRSRFIVDAGYGELQLTVADASGFSPGMGIEIFDSENNNGWDVTTAVITSINGNILYFDNYLIRDYTADKEGTVSNACSVISAVEAENVTISNLTIDGNRETNDALNGCRGGGIYLHKVHGAIVENVTVKKFNSDGISWQITEDVTVRNCEISGSANAGLHPGTGSPHTLIDGNNSHDNDNYGLFVCWRVRNGIVRNNLFVHNGKNGICTGHMDTDMLYEKNQISDNGSDGVNLRNESGPNAPHRSIFRNNLVENNGWRNGGYGFSFNSPAEGVILEDNTIQNTKGNSQKTAVFIDKNGLPVILRNNKISGHPESEAK
ncbi:MAG: right-handed parallel beta-helix repeat-containing protein [Bacteroidia bacterium]|nr:right-handed parallel beta-helix repeat-containing protein [Bacteroidia bacterium]